MLPRNVNYQSPLSLRHEVSEENKQILFIILKVLGSIYLDQDNLPKLLHRQLVKFQKGLLIPTTVVVLFDSRN